MSLFEEVLVLKEQVTRLYESMGGPYGDPFGEIGVISSVTDPLNLGRVQVLLSDGRTSDWAYVHGSVKGRLSSQFIGSSCMVSKVRGNSAELFVTQIFNKTSQSLGLANPIQIPLLSEQMEVSNSASDPGVRCNSDNVGKAYLFQNEISQDLAICLRRDNLQEGGEAAYAWKSLTHSKLVEKGFDTGVTDSPNITNLSGKIGIPKCSRVLEGEIREFTEDRKFRSTMMVCRRDENGDYGWMPLSAPPTVFRTTLPSCTEKIHGMEAIIDPGDNSELAICLRYQGQMKWVHPGTRRPVQFFPGEKPLSRGQMLASKKPIEALAVSKAGGIVGKSTENVLAATAAAIRPINSDPALRAALMAADALPGSFDQKALTKSIATMILAENSDISAANINTLLLQAISTGDIDDDLSTVLKGVSGAGSIIARGIETGKLDESLEEVGKLAINQAISSLSPEVASVYSAYVSGGLLGAIDSATAIGMSQLPPEVAQYAQPVWDIGKDIINGQPLSINNVIGSAFGAIESSLPDSVNQIVSSLGGVEGIIDLASGNLISDIISGNFGEVAQLIGNFANIPGMPLIGGVSGLPQLATTALGLVGLGSSFTSFLGPAGIGLAAFEQLTGIDPISTILGGIPGLGGLFGAGGGLDCPCDPKCRKTSHGEDSDGNKLLDPCGNVIKSGHSSYSPSGNPLENNDNPITNFFPTGLGDDLCVKNQFDLTAILKAVSRLKDLADRMEGAKYADWIEFFSELVYTLEAIEKALKQADNNITKIESIVRKLIDSEHRNYDKFFAMAGSFMPLLMQDATEHAQAIIDLYLYIKSLDIRKDGVRIQPVETPALLATKRNINQIPKLSLKTQKEARLILEKAIKPAHGEWKKLSPGGGLLELADIVLGLFNPDVPISFDCKTKNDKQKVLKDSLESKINSPFPPDPTSLLENYVPAEYLDPQLPGSQSSTTTTTPSISSILDQITYEQGRARDGKAEC